MLKNVNTKSELILNQTKRLWDNLLHETQDNNTFNAEFVSQFPILDIVDITHTTITIFNYQTFRPEYISENVHEILGYPRDEFLNLGVKLLFSGLHPDHSDFPLCFARLLETVFNSLKTDENNNILSISCGLKYLHPQKGDIRLLMHQYFIENDNNLPIRVLSTIQDVTHLMKDDFYYIRIIHGPKHEHINLYHNIDSKINLQNDIITYREKEVLLQIAKGLDTDEIAQLLSISRNTVNNHRQNMLNRLGVKDTTALLEMARLCHIV